MLITFENATFSYGDNLIFKDVNFAVNEGERVGLIGANGEGKTTLIKLISGELFPDSGRVIKRNGVSIGYLEQSGGYTSGNTVYGEMLEVFKSDFAAVKKLENLSAQLAETEYNTREYAALSAQIEGLQKLIASRDSYNVEVKIKTVLNGMGFGDRYDSVIDCMSGGEKTRLKLARLLLEEPDLLILDEPTNHLDISTLFWLEEYLQSFKGAVLTVSHDRYFLDKLTTRIFELENKKLLTFSGNYSKYKILKAELNARLLKEYEAQQEERAKLQDYVDRNIVRATTAKSALSRVNRLERMEILEKPYVPKNAPHFKFGFDVKPYEKVLNIENLNLSIGGKTLISGGQLNVARGEKVALVGENGTGKTTLLKAILKGNNREIEVGRFVKFAAYDQEGANLNGENTVLAELWDRHSGLTQTEVRSLLAACGLFEEDMQKPVKSLSGGERAKLALAILESERGNVLLLDEPTNHLDLPARESLEKALKEFDGTLLFVSHDRYFISALAEKVVEIENLKLSVYEGGYGFYTEEKKRQNEAELKAKEQAKYAAREEEQKNSYRSRKERAEEARRKEKIKKTESDIAALEAEENKLNEELLKPENLTDYKKLNELTNKLQQIKIQLDELYNEYETLI
ncbi:MAG: ABC-F family ATP-binding cassette domain-containing protein [Clostridia bacterium]|nr:ABC-F family ATP-binding cassette domain-containing protein [Clostridia bacterium]